MLGFFRAVLNAMKKIIVFLSHSLAWLFSWGFSRTGGGPGVVPGLAAFEEAANDVPPSEEERFTRAQPLEQNSQFAHQVRELALRMALEWPNHRFQSEAESGLPVAVYEWLCRLAHQELEAVAIMSDARIIQLFGWLNSPSSENYFSAGKTSSRRDLKFEADQPESNAKSGPQTPKSTAEHGAERHASLISFIPASPVNAGINAANDIGEIRDEANAHPRRMASLGR
jgi:hypothetical protein